MTPPPSLFDRVISRPRLRWAPLAVALLILVAAFAAAALDRRLPDLIFSNRWRSVLLAPAIILYIVLVSMAMERMEGGVIRSFRPLVTADDEGFNRLLAESSRIRPRDEVLAFAAGAIAGLAIAMLSSSEPFSWLTAYWLASSCLMYGLLAWTIYATLISTRLTTALLRQPLRIGPFDAPALHAVGLQSLALSLVFVGGMTLSLIFAASQPDTLRSLGFWLTYLPLVAVVVAVFFLNMLPTHRVLVRAKDGELTRVQRQIQRAGQSLLQRMEEDQEVGSLAAEISALAAYQQRLEAARTWPYNTAMLRSLFFSVLVPIVTMLARMAFDRLTQ
jgi:hypothetical protein